ncbi:Uncharacterized protein FWK35_00011191 [Aphis craccivora]|uniref:Phospholipase A2-like domain-containing protein n=1 Tax=Aphis craccivora TaxID=307492 RepID=A0A6G0Y8F9_APHCR|nr:Uncharacterized protein FWK35_00011191 [Aphis craccivora]
MKSYSIKFVFPQLEGPTMSARIVLGRSAPCLCSWNDVNGSKFSTVKCDQCTMSPARRSNKNKSGGYQYCGPGTNLKKRLARGDKGINLLDSACRDHDIAYERSNSITNRNEADHILEKRDWDRFKSKDSSLKEKAAS